jgi:hypothetical protein
MVQVNPQEFRDFKMFYLKAIGKKRFTKKMMRDRVGSRYCLDEEKTVVFSESHRLGESKYLVHPEWHKKFKEG